MKIQLTMKLCTLALVFQCLAYSVTAENLQSLADCMHDVDADRDAGCKAEFLKYFTELDVDGDNKLSSEEREPLYATPIDEKILPIYFPEGSDDKCTFQYFCDHMKTFKLPKLERDVPEDVRINFCHREQMIIEETCWDDWKTLFPDKENNQDPEIALVMTKAEYRAVVMATFNIDQKHWDFDRFLEFIQPTPESDHFHHLLQLEYTGGLQVARIADYNEPVNNCRDVSKPRRKLFIVTAVFIAGVVTASIVGATIETLTKEDPEWEDFAISLVVGLVGNGLTTLGCSVTTMAGCAGMGAAAGVLAGLTGTAMCEVLDRGDCFRAEDMIWNAALGSVSGMGGKFFDQQFELAGTYGAALIKQSSLANGVVGGLGAFGNVVYNSEIRGQEWLDWLNAHEMLSPDPQLVCPEDFVLTFTDGEFGECQQYDRNNEENRASGASSLQECAQACRDDIANCFAFDWKDGYCYKNKYCDYQEDDDLLSCRKFRKCPVGYFLAFPDSPFGECQQSIENDRETSTDATNLMECAKKCDEDNDCAVFDYHDRNCYLNQYCDYQDDDNYLSCRKAGRSANYRATRVADAAARRAHTAVQADNEVENTQTNEIRNFRGSLASTDAHLEIYTTDHCDCPVGRFDVSGNCVPPNCPSINCIVSERAEIPAAWSSNYFPRNGVHLFYYNLPSVCNGWPRVDRNTFCIDNPSWTNNYYRGCELYKDHGWCSGNGFTLGQEWTGAEIEHATCTSLRKAGETTCADVYNYPAENCCDCGKPYNGIMIKIPYCDCPNGNYNGQQNGDIIHCWIQHKWETPLGYDWFIDPSNNVAILYEYRLPTSCNGVVGSI